MTTRMRYFELPMEHDDGERVTTPFVLVFDRCDNPAAITPLIDDLKQFTGAKAVLAFPGEVEFE